MSIVSPENCEKLGPAAAAAAVAAARCIQAIIALIDAIKDQVSGLAEPACEGVPASRQLTDQFRAQQREIVNLATVFSARLRAREQGALFARFAVLQNLQEEVTVENASSLCRLVSCLTEVLDILRDRPNFAAKIPCHVQADIEEPSGAAGGTEPSKRGLESLGALSVNVKKKCRRPPTPHHSATAAPSDHFVEIKDESADEGEEALLYDKSPRQPDGPPDEEESGGGADEGEEDFLEKLLSPESDFSLSPRR